MQRYKHIYFDLDRTLWDFESNSTEALRDLYHKYRLYDFIPSFDIFQGSFERHNEVLWAKYQNGELKKSILRSERFHVALKEFGVDDNAMASRIGEDYISLSPQKTILFPWANRALGYLAGKYSLYIITNGFNEVQFTKLTNSGLDKYFKKVITSEDAGYMKPRSEIFEYALSSVNARKRESIMVGDDLETDIKGAGNAGIDQVFFNPKRIRHNENPSFEIFSLKELIDIF